MITRKGLADEIDRLDEEISELQKEKAQMFAAYREQLEKSEIAKSAVRLEIVALKAAIRQRRALSEDEQAVTERDDLTDRILCEIQRSAVGTSNATRAPAPRASEPFDYPDLPASLDRNAARP